MTTAKDLIRDFAMEVLEIGRNYKTKDHSIVVDPELEEKLDELMKEIADKICG